MKEYTLLAAVSVVMICFVDNLAGTRLLKQGKFYFFLVIIFGFKLLVNGYLTGKGVVLYNPGMFLGARIGSIPLEDFLFGFSMVSTVIISWEYFKKK